MIGSCLGCSQTPPEGWARTPGTVMLGELKVAEFVPPRYENTNGYSSGFDGTVDGPVATVETAERSYVTAAGPLFVIVSSAVAPVPSPSAIFDGVTDEFVRIALGT